MSEWLVVVPAYKRWLFRQFTRAMCPDLRPPVLKLAGETVGQSGLCAASCDGEKLFSSCSVSLHCDCGALSVSLATTKRYANPWTLTLFPSRGMFFGQGR